MSTIDGANPTQSIRIERAPPIGTWIAFSAMCAGMFMAVLDIQIVATSLPTIQDALEIRPDQMSWIQTSYLIAEVVAIPLTGYLTRALTMRWLSVATLTLFTLASVGCAFSGSYTALLAWRIVQGFAGGLLIPQVFAAGFLLFPVRSQALATTMAGVLAVLAPAVGPFIGGWITDTYSWPWLFLINVAPGVAAIAIAALLLPRERAEIGLLRLLDFPALALMAVALATFEIGLKEAPREGWASLTVTALLLTSVISAILFARRTLSASRPVVDLRTLGDRNFAIGALLSFILGMGLYGSVYLMPVFLAFVRSHEAVDIGRIMIVTGAAQLLMAPIAVWLEQRSSARLLTAIGFGLFAVGLAASAFQTRSTDFDQMLVPQMIRGVAIMLCLLPPIRFAMAHLPAHAVPDASGLFNLMRNLGGAIGLALIDTVIYGRAPIIGEQLGQALNRGDADTARLVGLPMEKFLAHVPGTPLEPGAMSHIREAVVRQATVQAINEAWAMIAVLTALGAIAVLLVRRYTRNAPAPGLH
jgi:DHA2 family multidrug resistance protein